MPIGFARVEFVKRSESKNAVGKAAYNSRGRMAFEGNCALSPKVYDYTFRGSPAHHEVLLPEGVDSNFSIPEVLWNAAEAKERKVNSQVAIDLVLALPDDEVISLKDRIQLAHSFVQEHVVEKGLGAQIDIHPPEKRILFTEGYELYGIKKGDTGVVLSSHSRMVTVKLENNTQASFNPDSFKGYQIKEHNWHAHVLVTTRRFKSNGLEFEDHKPRDLLPQVRKGRVVSGLDWGKLWTGHQNQYFIDRGMALRVDSNAIVPQEHLGPVRMRGRALDLFERKEAIQNLNDIVCQSPKEILKKLTEKLSVFTKDDVDRFFEKHVKTENYQTLKENFWAQPSIQPLHDSKTSQVTEKFSTQEVIDEEKSILRIGDRIHSKPSLQLANSKHLKEVSQHLTDEQRMAFSNITRGQRLSCIQGYAGTGKSYLLVALKDAYQKEGYRVRDFGPDNATCSVLKEKGFSKSENVMKFLFALRHGKRMIKSRQELWIVDEAGKLGNKSLLELLKYAESKKVQVVFSGDSKQLPSVDRGGMFRIFTERYPTQVLENIQRQQNSDQNRMTRDLAQMKVGSAISQLHALGGFQWSNTRQESIEDLASKWAIDTAANPNDTTLMLAHTNDEVRVLNELARSVKRERGELGETEVLCDTPLGRVFISKGDQLEFRKNDPKLGVTNGLSGTIVALTEEKVSVRVDLSQKRTKMISFSPKDYQAFQLGYASTYFRAQGGTFDRTYVLHSPHINKELFYVAMTRHSKEAKYFLSKDQVSHLSSLKFLASRDRSKELSLEYTSLSELKSQVIEKESKERVENLQKSEALLDRWKAKGISTWESMKKTIQGGQDYVRDKKHDSRFYTPPEKQTAGLGKSHEVLSEVRVEKVLSATENQQSFKKGPPLEKQLGDSFVKSVLAKTTSKEASVSEKYQIAHLVSVFKIQNQEEHQKKIEATQTHSEQEKLEWGYLKSAINLVNQYKSTKRGLLLDPVLNAKGGIRDSLAYQVTLFKAKFGKSPSLGQMQEMKQVIQSCEKSWSFQNGQQQESLHFAKQVAFEKLLTQSLSGVRIQKIDIKQAEGSVKEHASIQVEMAGKYKGEAIQPSRGMGMGY